MSELDKYFLLFDKTFFNYSASEAEKEYLEGCLLRNAEKLKGTINEKFSHLRNGHDVNMDLTFDEIQQAHVFLGMVKNALYELKTMDESSSIDIEEEATLQ